MSATRWIRNAAPSIVLTSALCACATAPGRPTPTLDPIDRALESERLHRHHRVALQAVPGDARVLRSPVISDGRPFTEALPSWNVAAETPFTVDVRARPHGSPWSPWLRIGDWNLPARTDEVPTTFDRGRVAVDVLRLISPMDELQLEVRPADEGGSLAPLDITVTVVLSSMDDLAGALEAADAEPWPEPVQLEVPARSQREDGGDIGHRICSPTSVAMALDHHGVGVGTRTSAAALRDPHHDIYGNWNRAVQGARSFGVEGRLARLSSWTATAAVLAAGSPVVASIRAGEGELDGAPYSSTAGHLLVITGLGPEGRVHVNDPAARSAADVPRVYSRADMTRVWLANGGVAYLFDGPAARLADGTEGR
ncbi:MAG: C39 family peptidase [Planctomycetota bacterium]|nr:C39 family peptidase [Planctomycetota bacterium]